MNENNSWLVKLRAVLGTGALAWSLGVDHLQHWPTEMVLVFWLLGAPLEELIRFFTEGRVQINVRDKKDEGDEGDE